MQNDSVTKFITAQHCTQVHPTSAVGEKAKMISETATHAPVRINVLMYVRGVLLEIHTQIL